MNIERIIKPAFAVIGKEGSTADGPDFITHLWAEATAHFPEVQPLAKLDETGCPTGFFGAMSDMKRTFSPWEDGFTRGLYLAGVECQDDALPPPGWVRWDIPDYEYLRAESGPDTFPALLAYIARQGISLAGAVHDFTDPKTGQSYMLFPIRKL